MAPFNVQIVAILHDALRMGMAIDGSVTDWVTGLHVSPETLGAVWRQRATFRYLSDRYREGIARAGSMLIPNASIAIGLDAFLMFEPHIGDRRARAFSRWIDISTPTALEALAPVVLCEWITVLLNGRISDGAVDQWLAEWDPATLADGLRGVDETRVALRRIDADAEASHGDHTVR